MWGGLQAAAGPLASLCSAFPGRHAKAGQGAGCGPGGPPHICKGVPHGPRATTKDENVGRPLRPRRPLGRLRGRAEARRGLRGRPTFAGERLRAEATEAVFKTISTWEAHWRSNYEAFRSLRAALDLGRPRAESE